MKHRGRNLFVALGCVLAFAALGFVLYTNWFIQKPFAVILFVTTNLNPESLTPARIYQGGADQRLQLESLPNVAITSNYSNDYAEPDVAAAASTLATGKKVNNGALSVDSNNQPLLTLVQLAQQKSRLIGLISNTSLLSPSLAAFYAPGADPANPDQIGSQLIEKSGINVLLGGNNAQMLPELKGGVRKDDHDLVLISRQKGYDIVRTMEELDNTPAWKPPKVLGLFSEGDFAFTDELKSAGPQPSLSDLVRRSIELLQYNLKGYFLIVEAGLVEKASGLNQGERTLRQLVELDQAIGTARAYAGENALIIVAGTASQGGLTLNGFHFRKDKGVAILGKTLQGLPAITWATGPGKALNGAEPVAAESPTAAAQALDVFTLSSGPGTEALRGFIDNTAIFQAISTGL